MLKNIFLSKAIQYLLPYTCILCGLPSEIQLDLCVLCKNDLPWLSNTCQVCSHPLPSSSEDFLCGACQYQNKYFQRTIAAFAYTYPINRWIKSLKFQEQLRYSKLLGKIYAEYLQKHYKNHPWPEVIVPVPLHKKRLQERGFNQSLELARELTALLKIPLDFKSCQRNHLNEPQSLVSAKKRHQNVARVFSCSNRLPKHVAIIDDVMTTGETVNSLSEVLLQQGAKTIDIWCIARASLQL